ncbi:CocE/NonD family hydrolase [Solimicrobium silvestre]|uniref:/NonD: hydrolase CocE/NonD family protein n=1 Tax=Solimicrobium silvestre TaxID=2099400 RepID=A0A2S9GWH7_9BURK|nr:CocE/NonD family hydrolase [Solimicrobium silvestre]PRC92087.1 /NonD: hydrolase CocE/NonD family protein [Solimicrobium silvestre]
MTHFLLRSAISLALMTLANAAYADTAPTPFLTPDIPQSFVAPKLGYNYEKRVVMIPMRDGVKLYTVIVVPKGAKNAPILLTRTPYNAAKKAAREDSPNMLAAMPPSDDVFVAGGYIRVFQDVRGKHGSEGDYVMTRPLRGVLNSSTVDHSTDAYDTIDYLVKNIPESNGKVGMIGSSYEGFTVVMALIHPHPALKVAAPESPMVDGWMGDDWFHHGAFRQTNFDYIAGQTTARGEGKSIARQGSDDYENFRRAGSAGAYATAAGLNQLPFWLKLSEHPGYDQYWQEQALDKIMARQPLTVPTMWLQGLWDQEDMWGAIHSYFATEPKDTANDKNFLVMGPWRHSGVNFDGSTLGPLKFDGDTALQFRRDVLRPFFDQYLKDGAPKANTPPVFIYNTGENHWDRLKAWPLSCEVNCEFKSKPIYLTAGGTLSFTAPTETHGAAAFDEYISDPAKPVPYLARPVRFADSNAWKQWLVTDQRAFTDRTDVLSYSTEPLTAPVKISGTPMVNLVASTSGTDSDWVVKLIDVFPDSVADQPSMGGYELAVGMDIFRGRYRESFTNPKAITPNKPLTYKFILPSANHTFLPGHRIMVQVQSSWFPLYDRNPQTFVPNIFFANPSDYVKATQRIYHAQNSASYISLPVAPVQ